MPVVAVVGFAGLGSVRRRKYEVHKVKIRIMGNFIVRNLVGLSLNRWLKVDGRG